MPAARRFTELRACAAAISPKVSTATARNTISASMVAERSPNTPIRMSYASGIDQILKFTSRYMMKLPIPIQHAAANNACLVSGMSQTVA